MRYKIDDNGFVIGYGEDQLFDIEMDGSEPFDEIHECLYWKYNNGELEYVNRDYKYIIIPTDIIPEIVNMITMVEDILVGNSFTVYLSKIDKIDRNNQNKSIKIYPVSFTPCSVINWENGDDSILKSVIDYFNEKYNPPRLIDFNCYFGSRYELENFIYKHT